jgi:hypothetical protein
MLRRYRVAATRNTTTLRGVRSVVMQFVSRERGNDGSRHRRLNFCFFVFTS